MTTTATNTAEYQNSNETDESCSYTGDNLGKLGNDFILYDEQRRENNDTVHDDAEHNSQNTANLHKHTHAHTLKPVTT